ncbi:ABC transporter ATP-binding protein/permease [Clostridium sporogenes]|uniref:ABC transporter ATP-binding protein n=1 Tax=Clostridium botulinum TaxID=1491 RepID=A0A6M0T062_CLOBO|nr:ABC transporter ATP-binding protein [Clostridium sporogenes]NFA60172.1 ABC transporter ATP-binding protein [Clostridium botulinum]NFI72853.1 ABC transporter ATP-binding protein [Clostridium sporogenes]NFL73160.1 ABC transporter ATP-binding protein [Clostridium sporogenes]NFM23373.1 ABC transporter ATP-binding protein [Clostridium sporogenes]NFP60266.1 ABC transporter ATP-binding protein [Clostridium sporogenes]
MFDKVMEYAGPHKKGMFWSTILILVSVMMGVVPFILAYEIISPLIEGQSIIISYVAWRVVGVLVCLVLQAVLYAKGLSVSHRAAYSTLMRLRISLQEKLEKLPMGVIQEKGTGTLKKLFVDDVDSLELLIAHTLPEGIANLMIPVVVYIMMFITDWKLAFLSLASVPISFVAMMIMYSIGMKEMGRYYQSGQVMNNTIIEYINGMEVIKVFNREGESYAKFKGDVLNYRDLTLKWFKACWPWMALYSSLLPCTIILTLPLGSFFVLKGYSTLSNLILVLCLSISIGIPLLKALSFMPALPQLNYKITALEQVLSSEALKETNTSFNGRDYTVDFNKVSFAYKDKEVIHKVSLTAKEGEMTALVGESGSGKSTLAKLLVHYYDINNGSISIGGQNICEMSLESLNDKIAYVAQDQYLFNISIMKNIRLGKQDATEEEVMEAAKKAQCMEFIERLPKGFHTLAGDSGNQLSGGQKQRITLARAILKNAPIIILDEATAFADPENEEKIEQAITELVKNKTLLVIAHRLSSIMDAHQICIMDNGSIASKGTHSELLESSPIYKKLWNAGQESTQWQLKEKKGGI